MNQGNDNGGERFTGHGPEWRDSNLSPEDARTATAWVEQVINKRSMEVNKDRVEDVRDEMWRTPTARRQDHLRLGQEDSDHPALAPQVLRPVRQHPRLPGFAAVADERNEHQLSR
jgi:heterodisulfide reductase subunit B